MVRRFAWIVMGRERIAQHAMKRVGIVRNAALQEGVKSARVQKNAAIAVEQEIKIATIVKTILVIVPYVME